MATAGVLNRIPLLQGLIALMPVILPAGVGRSLAEDEDTPLRISSGPCRGTVIDARTGLPLPSVAVVILWQWPDDQVQGLRRLVAAREAFTDENGEFVHDVGALERRLPPRTFAPRILIYRPGYGAVPSTPQLRPPGVPARLFAGPGAEVRLAPLADHERAHALNTFVGMLSASQLFPSPDLSETVELVRFELQTLGDWLPRSVTPGGGR
jgi:hypothetical protein